MNLEARIGDGESVVAPVVDAAAIAAIEASLPSRVWRCRCVFVGNTIHVVSAAEPVPTFDDAGKLTSVAWSPVEIPGSDRIVAIDWRQVAAFAFRPEVSASQIRRLYGLPVTKPAPEDKPGMTIVPCLACGEQNAACRRVCRKCGLSLRNAKPRPPRKRKVPTDGAAEAAPRKRRDRTGEHARALRQCAKCGSVTPHSEAKKTHRCSSCNHLF